MLIVGLMTGTSLDGIDAVLAEIGGDSVGSIEWRLLRSATTPYPEDHRDRIHGTIIRGDPEALCALHAEMGEWLATAALQVCEAAGIPIARVDVIGSHGQTIWHTPPAGTRRGSTFQIGCAATIAERTGVPVVSDFRSRDVAAGGHGAPLVPWVDRAIFALPDRIRALQNIGGIGNVTRVPPKGADEDLLAFDTGPGNGLIDGVVALATGGRLVFDRDGRLAEQGQVDEKVLADLLAHPYFDQDPPKTTGREMFGRPFVEKLVEAVAPEGDRDWLDLVATVTELTARSIADAYHRWLLPGGLDEVVVTGGGAHNPALMRRLQEMLRPIPVGDGAALGIGSTEKEALAFAVLAWAHVHGIPANVPSVTGATGPRVLGSFTPGARALQQR
ncbi:MAG TPA: anhydro-N-acetylmuramic acid kinase [Longimicrobiaceae bacterium]|nr:anhydro-N-acetylmuramic acid kinase [Longimicrobiaceae bacterium]